MDLMNTKESYGLHSPATLRKAQYGKPGTYSPITRRKNIAGSGSDSPAATSKTVAIPVPQSPNLGKKETSYSASPTRSFFNLFKKSKKKGSAGDMSESPSNSPDIQRRRRFFSSESNSDSDHEHQDEKNTPPKRGSESSQSSSSDDEEKQLAEGDITLFAVPRVISEPLPPDLTSILRKSCTIFPCRDDVEEPEQKQTEGEQQIGEDKPDVEHDKPAEVQPLSQSKKCDDEEKAQPAQEEKRENLSKESEKEKCDEDGQPPEERDEKVSKDEDNEERDDVAATLPRRRGVTWDPSVKDPKPRKDSYTTYIEGWHKEFLRQQRERKLRLKEMQKRSHYQKPQWDEPSYLYKMGSGISPFGACNISCDFMMSRW